MKADFGLRTPGSGRWSRSPPKLNSLVHGPSPTSSSSWWRTPSRALPYWRLDAKYPYLLPSFMLYGPRSSGVVHPHLLFSARWLVGDQRASSSLLMVLEQRRWRGGDLPQGPSEPGVQRTSGERTSPFTQALPLQEISSKSVHNFFSYPTDRQTNRPEWKHNLLLRQR